MSHTREASDMLNSQANENHFRRSSSSSSKSAASSVETTITKLLMSTKHLLQTLTQWSRGSANERTVSDAYVQLGNDFKVVSKVFIHCGVDVSDLGDVPMDLRKVLEAALREKPSDDNLNKYLPTIREIIVTLLDKLKVKQALLKTIKQDQSVKKSLHQQRPSVVSNLSLSALSSPSGEKTFETMKSPNKSRTLSNSVTEDDIPMSKDRNKNLLSPQSQVQQRTLSENEALSQLKKSSNLQRRASKRFSAYHMAKLTNQSTTEAAAAAVLASSSSSSAANPLPSISTLNPAGSRANIVLGENLHDVNSEAQEASTSHIASQDKPRVLFLSMNGKTKKCIAPAPLNINTLRLLFLEKFAYSPGGNSFPDLYIKDPDYSVFYELDELVIDDVCSGSVIELRESLSSTGSDVSGLIATFKEEIAKSQEDLLGKLRDLGISGSDSSPSCAIQNQSQSQYKKKKSSSSVLEMKKELSILRKLQMENKTTVQSTLAAIFTELGKFRTLSVDSSVGSNKIYIEKSQNHLGDVSDNLLSRVDDLQDLIETLRKDVAIRGARPSKKKLDSVQKELLSAQRELEKMKEYIRTEKPCWKTVWEKELDKVCEEQQFLTLQEDLAVDLGEDLGKALETFELVNLCCVEQEKNPKRNKTNPILPIPKPGELKFAREQLLMDVQSLHPDHDGRIEALEKAEKIWEKEREYRDNGEFEDELENFVEKASFKRLGGVEEVERLRKQKDEENLRANFAPLDF